jgi:hypothetical protein
MHDSFGKPSSGASRSDKFWAFSGTVSGRDSVMPFDSKNTTLYLLEERVDVTDIQRCQTASEQTPSPTARNMCSYRNAQYFQERVEMQ